MLDLVNPKISRKLKLLEQLEELDNWFDSPAKWCQRMLCINWDDAAQVEQEHAQSTCLLGGMYKVDGYDYEVSDQKYDSSLYDAVCTKILEIGHTDSITFWNDHEDRKFEDIKKLISELLEETRDGLLR
jgi:hypothetical protein